MMNVKTGCKGFPKKALLDEVSEIKGKTEAARARRRERRGKHVAFTKDFLVGRRTVKLTAAGHNKKVPLLLVATASSMLPGDDHKKRWTTINAHGHEEVHEITTKQPKMFELYRKNMNLVDLHNKLRQGEGSMSDVWKTNSWVSRHFAEVLGFLEVNVYKSLVFFKKEQWAKMSHNEFRRRLAWAFLTLGRETFLDDVEASNSSSGAFTGGPAGVNSASQLFVGPRAHQFANFNDEKVELHTCGYCGRRCSKYCLTCQCDGHGTIAVCGRKSGRDCIDRHQRGEMVRHGSWRVIKRRQVAEASATDAYTPVDNSSRPMGRTRRRVELS